MPRVPGKCCMYTSISGDGVSCDGAQMIRDAARGHGLCWPNRVSHSPSTSREGYFTFDAQDAVDRTSLERKLTLVPDPTKDLRSGDVRPIPADVLPVKLGRDQLERASETQP